MHPSDPRIRGLYVITDAALRPDRSHLDIVRAALAGGARIIQLRDPQATFADLMPQARAIRRLCDEAEALFIVNNSVELAVAAGADGVHLGPDDAKIEFARMALGAGRLIGASAGTVEEARRVEQAGADYLGVGSVFTTATKPEAGAPIGLEGLRAVKQATGLPVVAIGGVTLENIRSVANAGVDAAAVISAVVCADDMAVATRSLLAAFTGETAIPNPEFPPAARALPAADPPPR